MRNQDTKKVAVGGLLAALAVAVMSLGGLIPVATYICAALCILLCSTVLSFCGRRFAWAWYGAVSVLGILLGTDKEAAALYVFLGYYPIIRSWFDRLRGGWILKLLYFNGVSLILYGLLIYLFDMQQILREFEGLGIAGIAVTLLLGNMTFLLLDRLLGRWNGWKKRNG